MDDVSNDFLSPGRSEGLGLIDGVSDRNKALAIQAFDRRAMVEGDDIGRPLMLEKSPVHPGHFSRGDKTKSYLGLQAHGLQEVQGNLAKDFHP